MEEIAIATQLGSQFDEKQSRPTPAQYMVKTSLQEMLEVEAAIKADAREYIFLFFDLYAFLPLKCPDPGVGVD